LENEPLNTSLKKVSKKKATFSTCFCRCQVSEKIASRLAKKVGLRKRAGKIKTINGVKRSTIYFFAPIGATLGGMKFQAG